MSKEQEARSLGTADLVAAAEAPARTTDRRAEQAERVSSQRVDADAARSGQPQGDTMAGAPPREPLAALFAPDTAGDFESRWDAVQIGFVDDPREAVRQADELVAQVMKSLAESFANERERIENQLDASDSETTENMRVALRRYRSFFQRLLSL